MQPTYEIRSKSGRAVIATDSLELAKKRLRDHAVRVPGLRLFKVVRVEEEIAL